LNLPRRDQVQQQWYNPKGRLIMYDTNDLFRCT
jgi:hypothetical protein